MQVMRRQSFTFTIGFVAAVGLVGRAVHAAVDPYFPNFIIPAFFGEAETTYQEWNSFSSTTGPNTPVAASNPNGTPNAYDSTGGSDGAFLTGGRIYSPSGVLHPLIVVPAQAQGTGWTTRLILQVQTRGSEINTATVQVTAAGGSAVAPSGVTLLSQTPLGGFGGFQDDYQFVWDLAGNASSYTFAFNSSQTSMSWAGARVDTLASVPEPVAGVLLVAGAGALLRRKRGANARGAGR